VVKAEDSLARIARFKTISIEEAKTGMILAVGVYSKDGVLLLPAGKRLASHVEMARLKLAGISTITIRIPRNGQGQETVEERQTIASHGRHVGSGGVLELKRARQVLLDVRADLKAVLSPLLQHRAEPHFDDVAMLGSKIADSSLGNWRLVAARLPVAWTAEDLTYTHSVNVAALCACLARSMGLERALVRDACVAGLLHDAGVLTLIPTFQLSAGRLSDWEMGTLRRHADASARVIRGMKGVPPAVKQAVLHHHERLDGSGFQMEATARGKSSLSRIVGLADYFSNLLIGWPNGQPMPPHEVVAHVLKTCVPLFGADIVKHLVSGVGVYPVGTVVRLSSGELGVVASINREDLLRPELAVVFDADRVFVPASTRRIDLTGEDAKARQVTICGAAQLSEFGIDYVEWLAEAPVPGDSGVRSS